MVIVVLPCFLQFVIEIHLAI
nr:hypothetical protein A5881_002071 [Enterococcus termitis]